MRRVRTVLLAFVLAVAWSGGDLSAQGSSTQGSSTSQPPRGAPEKRIAFVVGNESYAEGALPTAANDAGLVAQTLQAAGFEVIGARDLDAETLRQSYADFLKRVTDAGPDTAAFVYLAGYGLQYGNQNYYVPIGANVSQSADIPIQTVRLSDLIGPLASMKLKAQFLVFDAAYKVPFRLDSGALGGLAITEPTAGSLFAFNAAPGTVAPIGKGNYGIYAQSLAAELRSGGSTPDEIFDRVRLRVSGSSKGAEVPWDASKIDAAFRFFERGKNAPAPVATVEQMDALTRKPLTTLPVQQAYIAAVARDTVQSYSDFDAAFGGDPLAKRTRLLLAARREALTWQRTATVDTPAAYWSYLARYPKGPHAGAAQLRLNQLAASAAPPADFQSIGYDVPPPPPDELGFFNAPVFDLDDAGYGLPPQPSPPDYWLPPAPAEFLELAPPPPPFGLFFLPVPAFVPLPDYDDPPDYVAYPADNYFYGGGFGGGVAVGANVFISNRAVVNNIHTSVPGGGPRAGAAAAGVVLPAAAQQRAAVLGQRGITTGAQLRAARAAPGGLGTSSSTNGNALPNRQQLPRAGANPAVSGAGRTGAGGASPQGTAANRATNAGRVPNRARTATAARVAPARAGTVRQSSSRTANRATAGRGPQRTQGRFAQRQGQRAQPQRAARAAGGRGAPRFSAPRGGAGRVAAPNFARARPGGFGGPRPSVFSGPRPGGFAGARPGGFAGPRPGGFGGPPPGGGGGPRPGGFGGPPPGGGGGPRPGGFGGGGPRPGPAPAAAAARPAGGGGGRGGPGRR